MTSKGASFATSREVTPRRPAQEVYLDHQASTPCDPKVIEAMMPFLVYEAGNPSSTHRSGTRAQMALNRAREQVAEALNCFSEEVFFTSGATESNNLAILGCAAVEGRRFGLVTTPIEHKSVLGPCKALSERGYKLAICPVRVDGQIDLGALSDLLDSNVRLVSVQLANNEIGTIQPVREVGQLAHRVGALFHVDAAQAFGKISVDVDDLEVDLLSVSAHKCYGPKGVGALYVRGGAGSGRIDPVFSGGGQEGGLRPGTENVPAIVGFGEATRICMERMADESLECASLRNRLEELILDRVKGVTRNGALSRRLPGACSLTFAEADAEAIIANAPEISISTSSACNSGSLEPSYVLRAIGLSREQAYRTIRCGVGRFTTPQEIEYAGMRIAEVVGRLSGADFGHSPADRAVRTNDPTFDSV